MSQTDLIAEVHRRHPMVLTLSNVPTMGDVENVVNSIGAQPMTSRAVPEIPDVVRMADAVVINIGSLDDHRKEIIEAAMAEVKKTDKPVVLDCDGAFIPYREQFVKQMVADYQFSLVRGNNREIATLAGANWENHGNSAVTINNPDDSWGMAEKCAKNFDTIVAITGEQDVVSDGQNAQVNSLGTPFFRSYVGCGDMVSSILAAFLTVSDDPFDAVVSGLEFFTAAGELAANELAQPLPGTFFVKLLDQLHTLKTRDIDRLHTGF